jgi:hypothetical protein
MVLMTCPNCGAEVQVLHFPASCPHCRSYDFPDLNKHFPQAVIVFGKVVRSLLLVLALVAITVYFIRVGLQDAEQRGNRLMDQMQRQSWQQILESQRMLSNGNQGGRAK